MPKPVPVVPREDFDRVLGSLLKSTPVKREDIKTADKPSKIIGPQGKSGK